MADIDLDRYDRQKRISGWSQEKIAASKILVVGAGALGNEVIKNLLQIGVNDITIVDYDTVVAANLNRAVFFTQADAEKHEFKALAIKREAEKINPDAQISTELRQIEEIPENFYSKFDCAFGCLDNLGARLHLNAQAYNKVPLIDGGTTGLLGKVQVVKSPSSCLECSITPRDYKFLWQKYSCTGEILDILNPKMPALPTTTSIIAGLQVQEFIKLRHSEMGNLLVGKYLHYDGLNNNTQIYELQLRESCPMHQ